MSAASALPASGPRSLNKRRTNETFEDLVRRHHSTMRRIVVQVGRRFCLLAEDIDDLFSMISLRLVEDDYKLAAKLLAARDWKSYYFSVARNLCRDLIRSRRGKWHNSKRAVELGFEAMLLENLVTQQGFSSDEAVEIVRDRAAEPKSRAEIRRIFEALPSRTRRRTVELPENIAATGVNVEERVLDDECRSLQREIEQCLSEALAQFQPDERRILKWRYGEGMSLAEIARRLGVKPRGLYTQHARCLRLLRRCFAQHRLPARECLSIALSSDEGLNIEL